MIPLIQQAGLPVAGLAALWLARRWVLSKSRQLKPPPDRRQEQEKAEREARAQEIRRDWGC